MAVHKLIVIFKLFIGIFALLLSLSLSAGQLTVVTNPIDGTQREAFYSAIKQFSNKNNDITVHIKVFEHEAYKKEVPKRLRASKGLGDVYFWFGGATMREFARSGLIEPLGDLWRESHFDDSITTAAKSAVTYNSTPYGLPLYYYQWGVYYRKSLFEKYGLTPPKSWGDLIAVVKALRLHDITPFTLGSQNFWTAAAWFDYLDLRLNGLNFHQELLAGGISFKDERVTRVFQYWKQLLDLNAFPKHPEKYDWKEALPLIYHNRAAMLLMGNFFIGHVPEAMRKEIGFFSFPIIDKAIPRYEEAPVDVLIVAKNAQNKPAAKRFLQFMAGAEVQASLSGQMSMIPANKNASVLNEKHLQAGASLLASAEGVSQFFDRDTVEAFSSEAMPLFVAFMKSPELYLEIQVKLEALRRKIWP